jgi:hypothetical protein
MHTSLPLKEAVARFRSTVERISRADLVRASDHRTIANHFSILADGPPARYGHEYRLRLRAAYEFVRAAGDDSSVPRLVWLAFLITFTQSVLTTFNRAERQQLLQRVLAEAATMPYPMALQRWAVKHVER